MYKITKIVITIELFYCDIHTNCVFFDIIIAISYCFLLNFVILDRTNTQ